ncbi:protein phosphatase CheZ [Rhodospirillum sp. A1_3_36]|uniref:protein phosphatase CheZ n=1 Tax=Rhodospirillum sp. A1_3_36 TaxID=3391666 RepID=UPI0039A765E7
MTKDTEKSPPKGGAKVIVEAADPKQTLDQILEHLKHNETVGDLTDLLCVLRDSLSGGAGGQEHIIEEIRALSGFIDAAREDLAALRPRDIQERFIPTASDELDAIVQATETATHDIMDAVEGLEDLAAGLTEEQSDVLSQATMRIYEACTFQDITGQRITKVVKTLKSIEERVDALLDTFGGVDVNLSGDLEQGGPAQVDRHRRNVSAEGDKPEDAALLNGPGMAGEAMNQDDIDALLKGIQ